MKNSKLSNICFAIGIIFCSLIMYQAGLVYPQTMEEIMNQSFKDAETIEDYRHFVDIYKPNELAFVAVQKLAALPISMKNWDEAIGIFQNYRDYFPGIEDKFDKIISLLEATDKDVIIKNLGSGVNTDKGEYCSIVSADGKKLYFTRNKKKYVMVGDKIKLKKDEDIYVSSYISTPDSEYWGDAKYLGEPICTSSPEAPQGISADGNILLLFGNYPGSLGRGDIFHSTKTQDGWSMVQNYLSPINSKYFESDAMLTADGKAILFVSDRPGAVGEFHPKDKEFFHGTYFGNTDIYVSIKTDSGWAEPINLDTIINTPYCERSPFLHPDGKTLYFSSDGHYGLGSMDVYKTTRENDTSWTDWSEPINLGKQYNSSGIDWGYRISTSGKMAFFSAQDRPDGKGSYDIYSVELLPDETFKPLPVTAVSGKVTDPNGNPLDVGIKWNDLTQKKEVGEATSDPQNGDYFIVLPAGHNYSYHAEKDGYIGKSEHLDLTDKAKYAEYTLDIVLYPIEDVKKGDISFQLNNIFFEMDKWDLQEESYLELDRWVKFLKQNEEIQAEIQGHTDNTGTAAYNDTLSGKRAQAVVDFLISRGVESKQLLAKGYGERYPVATNSTLEGRQKNRRVEINLAKLKAAR